VKEIEVKLPVADLARLRRQLRRLGLRPAASRALERNLVLDTPALRLRRSGQLLRLRAKAGRWWLTWKGPAETGRRHKVRPEVELEIRGGERLARIFGQLGYRPVFEYQKYRAEFHARGGRGKAMLDETPIGNFLELEGAPGWIDRLARRLDFAPPDYILDSYSTLYLRWCDRHGVPPSDMVFPRKKSLR